MLSVQLWWPLELDFQRKAKIMEDEKEDGCRNKFQKSFSPWVMAVLVVFLLFLLAEPAISQLNDLDNNSNSFLRWQLLNEGVVYATAQDLSAGDTVYAAAQCRNYLSTDECVACFDAGVSVLFRCVAGDSAYVVVDNCFIRYEDYADFYNNPNGVGTPFSPCGNTSASQPVTTFEDVVGGMLTEIRDAAPKASNFYVALTREIASDNETVYAIGQCIEGFSIWRGFRGNSSKTIVAGTIVGVALLFFILSIWLLYRRRKKAKETEQANYKGAVKYNYKDLLFATNHFGEENILGKGGFGEVFKATLDDNCIVAVKKLQAEHVRVKEEFENEVKLISHVHHRNLLRLLGWSSEGSERLLVLEYMPNGSLDRFLWDKVDTYSFGVVILEIISGRRSTEVKSSASSSDYLLEQAWKSYEKKIPMKFIDNTLDLNQYEKEHVMKTIEIALLCTQSVLKRPTMSEVVLMLQDGQSLEKRELTRPTFVNNLDRRVHIGSLKNSTAMGNVSRTQMN
ncbi:hypothetical protein L1887_11831 [Cichorium endivia]|nr:hypothetical protein L1887_11831 [Cichorium endivia]